MNSQEQSSPHTRVQRTFGADEAGRGPILGPLVISVVALDRGAAISLAKRGVCDSKNIGSGQQARAKRAALAELIRARAPLHQTRVISAHTVDCYTFEGKLNVLEREVVHALLVELGATGHDRIVCDGARLFAPLQEFFPQLQAKDNGESLHVSVAAASILAKHARDEAFAAIAAQYEPQFGPIAGGGYLNAATRRFLAAYTAQNGELPPEARKSWGAPKR